MCREVQRPHGGCRGKEEEKKGDKRCGRRSARVCLFTCSEKDSVHAREDEMMAVKRLEREKMRKRQA